MVAHALIQAFRRQKQGDLCVFKASLVYRVSYRTARATQRNPAWKGERETETETETERQRET